MAEYAPRYAIYFVPAADTALYRFGACVLGYDCYSGRDIPFVDGVDPATWPSFVREPRRYGFHATLKAPFRLTADVSEKELCEACSAFAQGQAVVNLGALAVREIGSFIALVPQDDSAPLQTLAASCVRTFDRFRAPMTVVERERRLTAKLTPQQIENIDRWGYPYVFEDFRFHMTLTGSLAAAAKSAGSGSYLRKGLAIA